MTGDSTTLSARFAGDSVEPVKRFSGFTELNLAREKMRVSPLAFELHDTLSNGHQFGFVFAYTGGGFVL
jgi:hypothetical protein